MASKGKLYIVTMYRWGDRSDHSYVLGVFRKKHRAIKAGETLFGLPDEIKTLIERAANLILAGETQSEHRPRGAGVRSMFLSRETAK